MSKGDFFVESPYERLVRKICGSQWRNLPKPEIDAAWGVAIVKSVLDGVEPEINALANHLKLDGGQIVDAYRRLNLNGVFKGQVIENDRRCLESDDILAWGYYGGYASGATGVV